MIVIRGGNMIEPTIVKGRKGWKVVRGSIVLARTTIKEDAEEMRTYYLEKQRRLGL